MQQEHNRLMQGLRDGQREALQERVRKMDQTRERVNTRFAAIDQELNQPNPDCKRIAQHARKMDRAVKEWQKQHRKMGLEMGINP